MKFLYFKQLASGVLFSIACLIPCLASRALASAHTQDHWVGTWACSPQLVEKENVPSSPVLAGNTLRQVIHITLGGATIRLRLSNEFGRSPLTIASVHIALPSGTGTIQPATDHLVTFGGLQSVTIPGGAPMFSDPVNFSLAPLSDLVITMQFDTVPEDVTGHPGSRATSFLVGGNEVTSSVLSSPTPVEHWYVLDGVDVVSSSPAAAVVVLGDSITDGRGSIPNQNTRWADYLAKTFAARAKTSRTSVLNEGIGGNRVLRDGLGPNALSRFDRDVIAQTSVKALILLEGVNDIGGTKALTDKGGTSTVTDELIQAYRQIILRAHAHGIKVFGGTITPFATSFYANESTLQARHTINAWIRTGGEFDGVVDFDKAVRNPRFPDQLDPLADSGDHLHPNSEGYRRMAAAINPAWFAN